MAKKKASQALQNQADTPTYKDYITVAKEHQYEYVIEKSRFIATLYPCKTEDEAQEFINRISKKYWDARHNCTAYAIGPRQDQQRSSDNGEPSGTAGKPMLEVLKRTGITNTAVVVTRYFGGIKLGAGGLIRAYSHTVAQALKEAPKELHTMRQLIKVSIDYNNFGSMERFLIDQGYHFEKEFNETVNLIIYGDPQNIEKLRSTLIDLTSGKMTFELLNLKEVTLPYKDKLENKEK